jgi:phenylpyruvate tautomerase PptA (4-oxalocrotonate tautomerase family)
MIRRKIDMPYMSIRISQGITPNQKKKLVEDIGAAIDKYVGIPSGPKMVEYELVDVPAENLARGGKLPAGSSSAYVIINVMNKRTAELKRGLAQEAVQAVAKQLGIPSESQEITVEIVECSPDNISHGGKLTLDNPPPGVKL